MVEWNKRWSPPFPCCPVSCQCPWKKTLIEKKRKEIIYSTEVLKCNLCDYSDAFILVRGDIAVTADPETEVAFKKCAPFTKCIIKIDGTTIWSWIFRFSHANIQFNRL